MNTKGVIRIVVLRVRGRARETVLVCGEEIILIERARGKCRDGWIVGASGSSVLQCASTTSSRGWHQPHIWPSAQMSRDALRYGISRDTLERTVICVHTNDCMLDK
jgi:hypothetical protein